MLLYAKDGDAGTKAAQKGNTEDPFVMVLTKRGADITLAIDGEVVLRHRDPKPPKGGHKFMIGGYLSRMYLSEVAVIKLGDEKKP